MRSKARLVEVASFTLAVALGPSYALAQENASGQTHWTVDKVLTSHPFDTIDIDSAGNSDASVKAWADLRTQAEREELMGRCGIITNPDYAPRYSTFAQDFCRHFMTVEGSQKQALR